MRYLLADGSNADALVADVLKKEDTPDAASEEYITRLSWEIRQYALAVMGQEKHAAEAAGEHITTSDVSREGTRYHALQGLYFKLFETLGRRQKT